MPRSAPAVRLHGADDRRWRRLCRSLALVVAGGTALWCGGLLRQGALGPWHAVVPLMAAGLAIAAWRVPAGAWEMRWDGAGWSFDGKPCRARATLDLGSWLLLSAAPLDSAGSAGRRRWLALSQRDHPAAWHGLRCALYCARPHSPHPPGHGAVPPPDER